MTNTDECLATHWRSAQPLTPRPLYILSTRASDWDSEVAVGLFFLRMTEDQQQHKPESVRGSRIERNPRALTWIYCLLLCFVVVDESMGDLETLVNWFLLHDMTNRVWHFHQWSSFFLHFFLQGQFSFSTHLRAMTWLTDVFNPSAAEYGNRSAGLLRWWRPHLVRIFFYFKHLYRPRNQLMGKGQELPLWWVTSFWFSMLCNRISVQSWHWDAINLVIVAVAVHQLARIDLRSGQ